MCDQPETPAVAAPAFAIEKAKIVKDVLDKKAARWHICSSCPRIMIFTNGKAKTGTCN